MASDKNRILKDIEESLRLRGVVPSIIFASVELGEGGFDGGLPTPFSDTRLLFKNKRGVIFTIFCTESVPRMLKKIVTGEKCQDDDLINDLVNFFMQENHFKYIKGLANSQSEAEIQSVLAHHLFSPLVPKYCYKIDDRCKHLKNCSGCDEKINTGDTSLGHADVWHGWPDILIDKSTITVKASNDEVAEDGNQLRIEEDTSLNGSLSVEIKKNQCLNSGVSQCIAQAITNAFYEAKKNPNLENYYIPSFLATPTSIIIIMYNCKTDRLFMSEDLFYFDEESGKVNVGTFTAIWLVLNFDRFFTPIPDQELKPMNIAVSNFPALAGKAFHIYRNNLSKPLVDCDRKRPVKRTYQIAPGFHFLDIKFLKKAKEEFQLVEDIIKEQQEKKKKQLFNNLQDFNQT